MLTMLLQLTERIHKTIEILHHDEMTARKSRAKAIWILRDKQIKYLLEAEQLIRKAQKLEGD